MKAWHFTKNTLRDGSPIPPIGKKLVHDGKLEMCESGLHASKDIRDALMYAPGSICHRVVLSGRIDHENDKCVASERTIAWSVDAEDILFKFARMCALDVIHLWSAPDVVVQFLKTGDKNLRTAARDAAWDAAWGAAWDAAWACAARKAAWDAAKKKQSQRLARMMHRAKS